jgi:hypothetical protein
MEASIVATKLSKIIRFTKTYNAIKTVPAVFYSLLNVKPKVNIVLVQCNLLSKIRNLKRSTNQIFPKLFSFFTAVGLSSENPKKEWPPQ